MPPCDAHATYTFPFSSNRPGRWFSRSGQNGTFPAEPGQVESPVSPLPGTVIAEEMSAGPLNLDRKSTRLNSSHLVISYAVFCLKKKKIFAILTIYSDSKNV